MLEALKKILTKLPIPGLRSKVLQVSPKTSQALRQLIRSYQRQKRLWIYIILSSVSLMVLYTLLSLLWGELWQGGSGGLDHFDGCGHCHLSGSTV